MKNIFELLVENFSNSLSVSKTLKSFAHDPALNSRIYSNILHGGSAFSAEDIGQSNQMNIIHPFCGRSEGFANHRQPKSALFTTTSRHGRIINGIESNQNAWPWQVRNRVSSFSKSLNRTFP